MESESIFVVSDKKGAQVVKTKSSKDFIHSVNLAIVRSLKLYLDSLYFLCIIPIRFSWSIETKKIDPTSFLPQKLICLVTLACTCTWIFYYLRFDYPTNKNSPKEVFIFLESLLQTILQLNFFKVLWFNQQEVQNLCNYILEINFPLTSSCEAKFYFSKFVQGFMLLTQFGFAILCLVTSAFPQSFHISCVTISDWMMHTLAQTRLALFFHKSHSQIVTSQGFEKVDNISFWSTLDYLFPFLAQ